MAYKAIVLVLTTLSFGAFAKNDVYCNGKPKTDAFGTYYPNGKEVHDAFGTYYPNGQEAFDSFGLYYPNGRKIQDAFGTYYPNGKEMFDAFGCYDSNGQEVECGGETFRVLVRADKDTRIRIAVERKTSRLLPMEFTESIDAGELNYTVDFEKRSIENVDLLCER